MEHVIHVNLIILWFYQDVDTITSSAVNMRPLNTPAHNVTHHSNYRTDIVIFLIVKSSMIMDVLLVNVDSIWLRIEHANRSQLVVLDIKTVFVKIVLYIINLKEEFVRLKDVNNMMEAIVLNAQVNMNLLRGNANSKIVSIGLMTNVLPVIRDTSWKADSVNNQIQPHADELIELISYWF